MEYPIRVLHVIAGMGGGGAESFLMNMYRNIDREKVQFDFLLRSDDNIYADELNEMGSRVYVTAPFPKQFIRNRQEVKRLLNEHPYKIIHVHANALLYMTALKEAKKAGVPCRIMHSHSISPEYKRLTSLHEANRKNVNSLATDRFACSDEAGKWMFDTDYSVIRNSIDVNAFRFSTINRNEIREELGINEDQFAVGHVGRMYEVKNHGFLLEVFAELLKSRPDSVLLLIGTGAGLQQVKDKAEKLGISDRVKFLGVRKDVNRIISAMDVFVFPSLYEGLPMAILEAQANGVQIFASEAVPEEANVTPCFHKLLLDDGAQAWAKEILKADCTRTDTLKYLEDAGFDIKTEAKRIESFYLSKAKEAEI